MPSDEDYRQTKRLKKSGASLPSPFQELADWISATYDVRVLNVIYDTIIPDAQPRLSVVVDTEEDALKFQSGPFPNYNEIDQQRVREHFESLFAGQRSHRFNVEKLLVIFVPFERVARIEANESVTTDEIDRLKSRLANKELWEISRCFDRTTFFFYTNAQVQRAEAARLREVYAQEYARLVQPHDEFGYLQRRGVLFHFDSKENFDTNYQGNWLSYYR